MAERNYLALPYDYIEDFVEDITNEELGELVRGMYYYSRDGVPFKTEGRTSLLVKQMMRREDHYQKSFRESDNAHREAGKHGGRPKKAMVSEEEQEKPKETKVNQIKPNETKPNQIEPNETKPNQIEPNETKKTYIETKTKTKTETNTEIETNTETETKKVKESTYSTHAIYNQPGSNACARGSDLLAFAEPPDIPPGTDGAFEAFWEAYPKKSGKEAARQAWYRIRPDPQKAKVIVDAVQNQKRWKQWQEEGGRYIPKPQKWLDEGRWEDEQTQVDANFAGDQKMAVISDFVQREKERERRKEGGVL